MLGTKNIYITGYDLYSGQSAQNNSLVTVCRLFIKEFGEERIWVRFYV